MEGIASAGRDADFDRDLVHSFEDHFSTVVPWLRDSDIVDHLRDLRKDEMKAAITLPSLGDDNGLLGAVDATV